ncbi:MAG: tRNA lysidine(34) synthetase TilS [Pseudoflavonifractor sp.]|nr:tRNA lysidine(34) synthetase TilS [Alloprevotella sp.]MCM1117228.1 tRNA lysidine(34) synthetase TilS [Pseudoflavonifractor sp.]
MNNLPQIIADTIAAHNLPKPYDGPIIAGLSGGPDSVALLAIMRELGYECIAAHANFHLRGDESNRDASFARRMALRLGADFASTDFDIDAYRSDNGGSVEMACRATRYDWMQTLAKERGAAAIAVGHHRDDNVETIMLNMARGTGIAGMIGMRIKRDNIIRPLIFTPREQIFAYLTWRGLDYVTDSTNGENDYLRNRLRNIAIPSLTRAIPTATDGIIATASRLAEANDFYRQALTTAMAEAKGHDGRINLNYLRDKWGVSASLIVYESLKDDGISRSQASNMLTATTGARFEGRENVYSIDLDGALSIRTMGERARPNFPFIISTIPIEEFKPDRNPAVAYFDEEVLSHNLTSRTWQRGDRIHPFGMPGSKLLSDLFIEARVSADARTDVALLISDGLEILFAGGVRASSRYPVGPMTRRVVRVECTALPPRH